MNVDTLYQCNETGLLHIYPFKQVSDGLAILCFPNYVFMSLSEVKVVGALIIREIDDSCYTETTAFIEGIEDFTNTIDIGKLKALNTIDGADMQNYVLKLLESESAWLTKDIFKSEGGEAASTEEQVLTAPQEMVQATEEQSEDSVFKEIRDNMHGASDATFESKLKGKNDNNGWILKDGKGNFYIIVGSCSELEATKVCLKLTEFNGTMDSKTMVESAELSLISKGQESALQEYVKLSLAIFEQIEKMLIDYGK